MFVEKANLPLKYNEKFRISRRIDPTPFPGCFHSDVCECCRSTNLQFMSSESIHCKNILLQQILKCVMVFMPHGLNTWVGHKGKPASQDEVLKQMSL